MALSLLPLNVILEGEQRDSERERVIVKAMSGCVFEPCPDEASNRRAKLC